MENVFYEEGQTKHVARRNLPHWDQGQKLYFVTFRLADSIPEKAMDALMQRRDEWTHLNKTVRTEQEKKNYYRLFNRKLERWLDDCHGSCVLADPQCGAIVAKTICHFDRERYRLDHWVIMPNHVHALLLVLSEYSIKKILHSWKSYSSNQINQHLGRQGQLWRIESFDCIVRNALQLAKFRWYIIENARKVKNKALLSTEKWDG